MRKHPFIAATLLAILASPSFASENKENNENSENSEDGFTLTFGVESSRGSITGESTEKAEISPLLGLDYRRGRFFASTSQGLGYEFVQTDLVSAFVAVGYDAGRKESKANDKKANQRLVGMGEVKSGGLLVVGVGVAPFDGLVNFQAALLKSTRSENGTSAIVGAGVGFPVWGPVSGFADVGVTYADSKQMQTLYGVTAAQSARSGNPIYTPKAGLVSTTFSLGLNWEINEQWSASASVGREQLMGDAKDSPLFKTKNDNISSFSVSYRF
jgi:MipA family protein